MNWHEILFIASFLVTVYFIREAVRAWRSPEFKRDLARLREQRRRRKAAKR